MTELGTHAGHIRVQRSAHMGCGTRQKAHVMNRIFVHARALVTLEEKLVAKFKYFHDKRLARFASQRLWRVWHRTLILAGLVHS
jgi:hypothetical protein